MAGKTNKIRTSGSFKGQSNKLGYGGRAAQLRAKGVLTEEEFRAQKAKLLGD